MIKSLEQLGHECVVCSYDCKPVNGNYLNLFKEYEFDRKDCFSKKFNEKLPNVIRLSSSSLVKSIKAFNPDIINTHWLHGPEHIYIPLTILKKLGKQIPIVWTLHDMWPFTGGCVYSYTCSGYINECSDCQLEGEQCKPNINYNELWKIKQSVYNQISNLSLISPSQWLANRAIKSPLFQDLNISVVSNSLDLDIFKPIDNPEKFKQKLGIPLSWQIILCPSSSYSIYRKGLDVLINSLKLQNSEQLLKDSLLILIGPKDPRVCKDIRMIPSMNVMFTGQLKSEHEVAKYYSIADITVLPSRGDNQPSTIMESLACGTPVITSSAGGCPEMIIEEVNGWTFEVEDIYMLHDHIKSYFSLNKLEKDTISKQARNYALEHFQMERQAIDYEKVFSNLVSNPRKNIILKNIVHGNSDFIKTLNYKSQVITKLHKVNDQLKHNLTSRDQIIKKQREDKENLKQNLKLLKAKNIELKLQILLKKYNYNLRIALFGNGKHTQWLLSTQPIIQENTSVIFDDAPKPTGKIPILPPDSQFEEMFDFIIPSSDTIEEVLTERIKNTFQTNKIFSLYA
ncbi:MAG: glycosyltransferase [Lentisphaerales bacterium]|nr:glycosyltransferase [Lentisphaerales bacterium]